MSSLLWGTWIEIAFTMCRGYMRVCRPSYEGRGLKSLPMQLSNIKSPVVPLMRDVDWNAFYTYINSACGRRPSYEGRGLKYPCPMFPNIGFPSSLLWGTWIEIIHGLILQVYRLKSSLLWGTWIEICLLSYRHQIGASSLLWGTWIEMLLGTLLKARLLRRPSYEGRGLKYIKIFDIHSSPRSSLLWGTWIEMRL